MTWAYLTYKALGAFGTPPGVFIFVAVCGGLFFLFPRDSGAKKRFAPSMFLFFLASSLYMFSIPWSVKLMLSPMEDPFSFELPSPKGRSVVLVLSGGVWSTGERFFMSAETLQRFITGIRVANALKCPLLFTGGYPGKASEEQIREMVFRTGKDMKYDGTLLVEGNSRTTWENMKFSAPSLRKLHAEDIVLVTTAYHLNRSVSFAARFFPECRIHACPSGRLSESGAMTAMDFLPSPSSFQYIAVGVRELVGTYAYALFSVEP